MGRMLIDAVNAADDCTLAATLDIGCDIRAALAEEDLDSDEIDWSLRRVKALAGICIEAPDRASQEHARAQTGFGNEIAGCGFGAAIHRRGVDETRTRREEGVQNLLEWRPLGLRVAHFERAGSA